MPIAPLVSIRMHKHSLEKLELFHVARWFFILPRLITTYGAHFVFGFGVFAGFVGGVFGCVFEDVFYSYE
jgi:hypothetical protein